MRSLVLILIAAASCLAFEGMDTEWEDMAMDYTLCHCVTWDEAGGRMLVGTYAGFHSLDLDDYQWTAVEEEGVAGLDVYSIDACCTDSDILIVGRSDAQDHGYMEVSYDYGETWLFAHSSPGGAFRALLEDAGVPGRWFAGGISYLGTPGEMLRSDDNGYNWTSLSKPQTAITALTQSSDGAVYSCGMPNVYKSVDGGETWESAGDGLSTSNYFNAIAAHPSDPGVLICSDEEGIYKTTDGGESWYQVGDQCCMVIEYCPGAPEILAARVLDFSIIASEDGGESWFEITGDLPGNAKEIAFCGDDGHLYAATMYEGTYRTPVETAGSAGETAGSLPSSGLSLSVSPNPVMSSASVSYRLPQSGSARVDLFDVSGRLVRTLDRAQMSAGTHQSVLNVSDSDPGVFFVRLSTESGSTVQKVLISR